MTGQPQTPPLPFGRIVAAFMAGAAAPAVVLFALLALRADDGVGATLAGATQVLPFLFVTCLVALVALGGPAWLVCHWLGLDTMGVFGLLGAGLAGAEHRFGPGFGRAVETVLFGTRETAGDWSASLACAALGALAALVLWRVAYGGDRTA
ncbi:MAG: hypothetical protein ACFBWO_05875 [Paracoccaceae bacterium]